MERRYGAGKSIRRQAEHGCWRMSLLTGENRQQNGLAERKAVKMNMEFLLQYATYALMAIGGIAFLVSAITQVIKEMPVIKDIQTGVVALIISFILCPTAVVMVCQYYGIRIAWHYIFASFIAACIVYLVATGGWESPIWLQPRKSE